MSKETLVTEKETTAAPAEGLLIDEFEIIELEDRLELAGRCNNKCAGDELVEF